MQAIRQFHEAAPQSIEIPEFLQHKRLQVILLVQGSAGAEPSSDLKALLAAMPNVGEDADFSKRRTTNPSFRIPSRGMSHAQI